MTRTRRELAVQQLVYTAQAALQRTAPVQFALDGGPHRHAPRACRRAEPLDRGATAETLAPVWIIEPAQDGDTVRATFTVEGVGAFFEANVSWQLLRGGEVVQDGFATAAGGLHAVAVLASR